VFHFLHVNSEFAKSKFFHVPQSIKTHSLTFEHSNNVNSLQVNLSQNTNMDTVKTLLLRDPHVLVGTPAGVLAAVKSASLSLSAMSLLILDEADLQFSYGYSGDISELRQHFPPVSSALIYRPIRNKSLCFTKHFPPVSSAADFLIYTS